MMRRKHFTDWQKTSCLNECMKIWFCLSVFYFFYFDMWYFCLFSESTMADESKDIKKLIKLQKQRPSFSRMISWEISEAAEYQPVKKGKRKKKKVIKKFFVILRPSWLHYCMCCARLNILIYATYSFLIQGFFFVLFYSRYWVVFPIGNSIFFPNSQEKILSWKLEN